MSDVSSEKKPKLAPANLGRPGWIIVNAVLIFIVSQLLSGLLIGIALSATHRSYNDSVLAQFSFVLLSALFYVLLVWWWLKRRGHGLAAIGLGRRPAWRDLKRALLALIVLIVVTAIANILMSLISPEITDQRQDLGFDNLHGQFDYTLAFVALVFFPAVGEETLMRGYLYSGLRHWWTIPWAAVITSVLFALPHMFEGRTSLLWAALVDTFILSLILIYLREKTGALYAGMMLHGFNNTLAFGVYFQGLILLR
jgi:membrane protease YdiL (CAAX protease family)